MAKKVAVIGAGASGLAAIKCCLEEGLDVTCFEKTGYIGGLWQFTEDAREGEACVMKTTVINACKEMMCYSDFPIPKEFPNYMPHEDVMRYFHLYADKFNLKQYIRHQMEVVHVRRSSSFSTSGQWDIRVRDIKTGVEEEDHAYDAVLICTGHHAFPKRPHFPGLDTFPGKIVHSHDYKDGRGFENKRVVIIGIGNSGGDISVELSRVAQKTYLSTRRGAWIWYRVNDNGTPGDLLNQNRLKGFIGRMFPKWRAQALQNKLNRKFDHKKYSLQPNFSPFSVHPTLNDDLPNRIISGSVIIKANVDHISASTVTFEDGTAEKDIDAIIMATGYIFGFPFLEKEVLDVKNNKIELFKYVFPPDLERPTLGVIGCVQPLGAVMPIAEMQCRYAARVFKGVANLPPREAMWRDIRAKQHAMAARYLPTSRHTIQVDFMPFMSELAELYGCQPNLLKIALTDPKLAYQMLTGPCIPAQFRLTGPNAWPGARETILSTWDRVWYPLKTRPLGFVPEPEVHGQWMKYTLVVVLAILVCCFIA